MIPVLLADDDLLTLDKLRTLIDWNALGCEIAGLASNGVQALELTRKLQIQILILDIDMPKMNGVDVTAAIHEQSPGVCVLILSNYDNYAYVRAALRYGVCDYLLKHQLTPELLTQKVKEMRERIDRDRLFSSRMTYFSQVAKQQYLRELALGESSPQQRALMGAQAEFASPVLIPAALRLEDGPARREGAQAKLLHSALNLCQSILSSLSGGLIAHVQGEDFALLFCFEQKAEKERIGRLTGAAAHMLVSNLNKVLGTGARCLCGDPIGSMADFGAAYARLTASLEADLPREEGEGRSLSPHIQKAVAYIRGQYAQDISLGSAAEALALSPEHLSRLFRKETGVSFIDFLNDYRIKTANYMLLKGSVPLCEVHAKVGFRSYNYFLHVFKKRTGMTPTQMLEQR